MEAAAAAATFFSPPRVSPRRPRHVRHPPCLALPPPPPRRPPARALRFRPLRGGGHQAAVLGAAAPGPRARDVVAMVVPFLRGTTWQQPPPDLASFLYKNRIVYLGMCLVPSVTELMLAEFLHLHYDDAEKPIYLHINSTGTTKVKLLSRHIGKSTEEIARDIRRPKYFSPGEAVDYGHH